MQALSTFGILLLYLALAAAPPSTEKAVIHFSEYNRMTLTRTAEDWFVRETDLGSQIFHKNDGMKLLTREDSKPVVIVDLSTDFDLTGKEDWLKPQRISFHKISKSPEDRWVRTTPEKTKFIVEASQEGKPEKVTIEWVLKKN